MKRVVSMAMDQAFREAAVKAESNCDGRGQIRDPMF